MINNVKKLQALEDTSNHLPTHEETDELINNITKPTRHSQLLKDKIQDYENERENIQDLVDSLIKQSSQISDDVMNNRIDDIHDRVQNLNRFSYHIHQDVKNLVSNVVDQTNLTSDDVRNWVNQNDKIDSQQAQQNTNLVNNKTANLVNINQQIRYLNQQLRDQLTKSLVLKSQNKSSENTRHRY